MNWNLALQFKFGWDANRLKGWQVPFLGRVLAKAAFSYKWTICGCPMYLLTVKGSGDLSFYSCKLAYCSLCVSRILKPTFCLICILQWLCFTLITLVLYFVKQSCASIFYLKNWKAPPLRYYQPQSPRIVIVWLRSSH